MRSSYKVIVLLMISFIYQGCGNENSSSPYSSKVDVSSTILQSSNVDVNFTILHSSQYSNYIDHHSKILKVMQTQSEYVSELLKYFNDGASSIDFSTYNVILADLGERSNNSYFIEIPSVYEDANGNLHVVVVSKEAKGENCTASDVMTDPYVFAKVPAGKDVYFDERVEYYNCP